MDKVMSLIGRGYALASEPVMGNLISTDLNGIECEEIIYSSNGVNIPAFISRPINSKEKKLPVILIVSEIFGVHEYIADITRRFAKMGYMAIAPELFSRIDSPSDCESIDQIQNEIIKKTPDDQIIDDLNGAINWALRHRGDASRVGVTGFCWGGRVTWLACQKIQGIKSGVAWYGKLTGLKTINTPNYPLELVNEIKCPVLGLYGGADTSIPLCDIEHMSSLLKVSLNKFALQSQIMIYPDAPHAFHADYRINYREVDAKDAWMKCLSWFGDHGVI